MAEDTVEVQLAAERGRYEISVNGELAGFAQFVDREDRRIFFHTEVAKPFGGRGLGKRLVHEALEGTVEEGKKVVPVCKLVKSYTARHPEFDAAVVRPESADHAAIKSA